MAVVLLLSATRVKRSTPRPQSVFSLIPVIVLVKHWVREEVVRGNSKHSCGSQRASSVLGWVCLYVSSIPLCVAALTQRLQKPDRSPEVGTMTLLWEITFFVVHG